STALPAANGSISRTGRTGYFDCAPAQAGKIMAAITIIALENRLLTSLLLMRRPAVRGCSYKSVQHAPRRSERQYRDHQHGEAIRRGALVRRGLVGEQIPDSRVKQNEAQ